MPTKPTPRPAGATYRLNRTAAVAVHEAEATLTRAGLPSYMGIIKALAACAMILDGRDKRTRPDAAARRVAELLEPLRPTEDGLASWGTPR